MALRAMPVAFWFDDTTSAGFAANRSAMQALVDELALFHTAEYIDKVSRMSAVGKGWLDEGDTPAVKGIYDSASAVVGAVLCAVDEVMHGNHRRAFVPIAGLHHAARNRAAGFAAPIVKGLKDSGIYL